MNVLKPEIITLFKQRQQMAKWLRDHGKTREDINQKLENWSIEERTSSSQYVILILKKPYFFRNYYFQSA